MPVVAVPVGGAVSVVAVPAGPPRKVPVALAQVVHTDVVVVNSVQAGPPPKRRAQGGAVSLPDLLTVWLLDSYISVLPVSAARRRLQPSRAGCVPALDSHMPLAPRTLPCLDGAY